MIHSMSGGIIRDYGSYMFVKVKIDVADSAYWYISDIDLEIGDRVRVPFGKNGVEKSATVVKIENVSGQVTPIPLKSARKVICKL